MTVVRARHDGRVALPRPEVAVPLRWLTSRVTRPQTSSAKRSRLFVAR